MDYSEFEEDVTIGHNLLSALVNAADNQEEAEREVERLEEELAEAKKRLKAKGIIYESIKEVKESFLDKIDLHTSSKISASLLSQLTKNLAIYLKSGIAIVNVIRLAKNQYENEPLIYDFLTSLQTSMDEGNSFYHFVIYNITSKFYCMNKCYS